MKSYFIFALIVMNNFAFSQLDIIILKDSSILKGTILEINPTADVKINTTCCGVISILMTNIDKIIKVSATQPSNEENDGTANPQLTTQEPESLELDDEQGNKKGENAKKFFKELLITTVDVLTTPVPVDGEEQTNQEVPENISSENSIPIGNICFQNQNNYPRDVEIINKSTNEKSTLRLPKSAKSCLYDLEAGTYSYVVYSVNELFNGRVITAQSQIVIEPDLTKEVLLIVDDHF